jgi:hypothetical protein
MNARQMPKNPSRGRSMKSMPLESKVLRSQLRSIFDVVGRERVSSRSVLGWAVLLAAFAGPAGFQSCVHDLVCRPNCHPPPLGCADLSEIVPLCRNFDKDAPIEHTLDFNYQCSRRHRNRRDTIPRGPPVESTRQRADVSFRPARSPSLRLQRAGSWWTASN